MRWIQGGGIRVTFQVVTRSRKRQGQCTVCDKTCTRTHRVSQTINPFNTDKNGQVKTHDMIVDELKAELDAWDKTPLTHQRCEST